MGNPFFRNFQSLDPVLACNRNKSLNDYPANKMMTDAANECENNQLKDYEMFKICSKFAYI